MARKVAWHYAKLNADNSAKNVQPENADITLDIASYNDASTNKIEIITSAEKPDWDEGALVVSLPAAKWLSLPSDIAKVIKEKRKIVPLKISQLTNTNLIVENGTVKIVYCDISTAPKTGFVALLPKFFTEKGGFDVVVKGLIGKKIAASAPTVPDQEAPSLNITATEEAQHQPPSMSPRQNISWEDHNIVQEEKLVAKIRREICTVKRAAPPPEVITVTDDDDDDQQPVAKKRKKSHAQIMAEHKQYVDRLHKKCAALKEENKQLKDLKEKNEKLEAEVKRLKEQSEMIHIKKFTLLTNGKGDSCIRPDNDP